jgi:hypothetical protein
MSVCVQMQSQGIVRPPLKEGRNLQADLTLIFSSISP